jgi:spore maturation protein SpmA
MVLNFIWIGFFLVAFLVALIKLIFLGDTEIFPALVASTFDMAEVAVKLCIGYIGMMALWLGIMKIGEKGGAVNVLARLFKPFFRKIFPDIPDNHPAHGSIMMNFAANMLGLDNAATPLGLKAMNELQELNPKKDTASNAQIMFLVLNTSGLTLIPVSIMGFRAIAGAANPTDIFLPILLTTFCSSLVGLLVVSAIQKINLLNKVVITFLGSMSLVVGGLFYLMASMQNMELEVFSSNLGNIIIIGIIVTFIILAIRKKINVYETFVEGAKDGFTVAIKIIPYLVAMLVAIGVFRTSGALDYLTDGIGWVIGSLGFNTDFVDALPTAFMKPLSGSGSRALMVETMNNYGADSFVSRVACTFQGSTETTFYTLAVYFGAVNIRKTRYAVGAGLIADLAAIIAAIVIAYIFFY